MINLDEYKQRMQKAIDTFDGALKTIRTSSANPNLIAGVHVDYYGMDTPINQIATVGVVEGKQLLIRPYEATMVKTVEKALFAANLGLTPQNEGTQIRIVVPPLTEERRREYTKNVEKMAEEARIAVRNVRRDANDAAKKDKTMPEDVQKDMIEQIQKATDEAIKNIDNLADEKNKAIMTI